MNYTKPHSSVEEQIDILKQRGLIIDDNQEIKEFLSTINYFRLVPYMRSCETGTPEHIFKEGMNFKLIRSYYDFDRELRLLTFDMIERFEIAFRTKLSYYYSHYEGDPVDEIDWSNSTRIWWFEKDQLFKQLNLLEKNLNELDGQIGRTNEVFINHHKNKYSNPTRLPSWKSFEVISIGLLSKYFSNLKSSSEAKKSILRDFGLVKDTVLESWIINIAYIRNICAHHGRLWNRTIIYPPAIPKTVLGPWLNTPVEEGDYRRLYLSLCSLKYLLNHIDASNGYTQRILTLFQEYPEVWPQGLGFPENWESEPVWV